MFVRWFVRFKQESTKRKGQRRKGVAPGELARVALKAGLRIHEEAKISYRECAPKGGISDGLCPGPIDQSASLGELLGWQEGEDVVHNF